MDPTLLRHQNENSPLTVSDLNRIKNLSLDQQPLYLGGGGDLKKQTLLAAGDGSMPLKPTLLDRDMLPMPRYSPFSQCMCGGHHNTPPPPPPPLDPVVLPNFKPQPPPEANYLTRGEFSFLADYAGFVDSINYSPFAAPGKHTNSYADTSNVLKLYSYVAASNVLKDDADSD